MTEITFGNMAQWILHDAIFISYK